MISDPKIDSIYFATHSLAFGQCATKWQQIVNFLLIYFPNSNINKIRRR